MEWSHNLHFLHWIESHGKESHTLFLLAILWKFFSAFAILPIRFFIIGKSRYCSVNKYFQTEGEIRHPKMPRMFVERDRSLYTEVSNFNEPENPNFAQQPQLWEKTNEKLFRSLIRIEPYYTYRNGDLYSVLRISSVGSNNFYVLILTWK